MLLRRSFSPNDVQDAFSFVDRHQRALRPLVACSLRFISSGTPAHTLQIFASSDLLSSLHHAGKEQKEKGGKWGKFEGTLYLFLLN